MPIKHETERMAHLLENLSTEPDISKTAALLAYEMHCTPEMVELTIEAARLDGHLIVDNARGYYLATSMDDYQQWRTAQAVPELCRLLKILLAMDAAAEKQINV